MCHAHSDELALSSSSSLHWKKYRICKQVIRFEILPNLDSLSQFSPEQRSGHTHSNQVKPRGMQSPVARLTTADPTMPGARRAPRLGLRALVPSEEQCPRTGKQLRPQSLGSTPESTFNLANASPNSQESKIHLF